MMKKYQHFKNRLVVGGGLVLLLVVLLLVPSLFADNQSDIEKELEKRLQQIMEDKTHDFFNDMTTKEQYLNYVTQGVLKEIKQRRNEGGSLDETEFNLILGIDENIVTKYEKELSTIVHLFDELNTLKKNYQETNNPTFSTQIEELQSHLKTALDDSDTSKSGEFSEKLGQQLIVDYNLELDRLTKIVRELQKLKRANVRNPDFEKKAEQLENSISNAMNDTSEIKEEKDPLLDHYIDEVIKIVDILRQLDELDQRFPSDQYAIHDQIRQTKERILAVVDREALLALGYKPYDYSVQEHQLSTYFDEWKARQILWHRAKTKQAELLKSRLIEEGTAAQIRRMFETDVYQAANEFNKENFVLAGYLFQDLLHYYRYKNMNDIRYYLAECLFVQKQFAKAQDHYLGIVNQGRDKEFVKNSYWRLMLISETYNRFDDFFGYGEEIKKIYRSLPADEFLYKITFHSGYLAYQLNDFEKSLQILTNIPEQSSYFLAAQYLMAVDYLNQNQTDKALPVFSMLGKESSYHDKNEISIALRNQALLKLGLVYYMDNDLANALRFLVKVDAATPGYDVALLSKAWTWFRLGDLQQAANELDLLLWNHMNTNYIYEAMMLSAHCNRLLGNVSSSTRKVRYVENAGQILKINNEMNAERRRINELLQQIENMEEPVVLAGDVFAFQRLEAIRRDLELSLQSLSHRGDPGLHLIEEYEDEQQRLEKAIADLRDLYQMVDALGRGELKQEIRRATGKLEARLLDVQRFQTVRRVDVLSDYPLAQKESDLQYQKQSIDSLRTEAEDEQQKLQQFKSEIAKMMSEAEKSQNSEAIGQLDYRQLEVEALKHRLDTFMGFLAESKVKIPDTDYKQWSDFSGFGMSDLDFVRMKNLDKNAERFNDNIALVNMALKYREQQILREIARMDERIKELQKEEQQKNLEKIKSARERYFAQEYFLDYNPQAKNESGEAASQEGSKTEKEQQEKPPQEK